MSQICNKLQPGVAKAAPPSPLCADICIIGAGVVGLAAARTLAQRFPDRTLVVIEQHGQAGQETSSRHSEVIHAGIYYPPGSLKAQLCMRGRDLLYEYCRRHNIAHQRLGKLILAQAGEETVLETLEQRALANGVSSLHALEAPDIKRLEPEIHASTALFSPETGIIDSHQFMQQLQAEAERHGAVFAWRTCFLHARRQDKAQGFALVLLDQSQAGEPQTLALTCRVLINCAGLNALKIAAAIDPNGEEWSQMQMLKGNYFDLSGRSPFSHLIYPVPDPQLQGLGIHATLDLAGQCRFGPDVQNVQSADDYQVDEARRSLFATAIRRYYPALNEAKLQPAYAGIRPRLAATQADFSADFQIRNDGTGLVHLLGIESPGMTASLALAEMLGDGLVELDIL